MGCVYVKGFILVGVDEGKWMVHRYLTSKYRQGVTEWESECIFFSVLDTRFVGS